MAMTTANQAQQAQSLFNQQQLQAAQMSRSASGSQQPATSGPNQAQQMQSVFNQQQLQGAQLQEQARAQAPQAADAASVSSEASAAPAAKPQNPYEGVADGFSSVTVDPWKKGKNDTLEGMLRNQGYSLKDIYSKDKSGKTLIDHVAKANNLKNPNLIADGAALKIPQRANSKSMSSEDLKNGQSSGTEVSNKEAGVSNTAVMSKDDQGATRLAQSVDNKANPDAGLSTGTSVGEGGRIDSSASKVEGGVESNTVAMNKNGSAVTQERVEGSANGTTATIKDIDRGGDNLSGVATADGVTVSNPGSNGSGNVNSSINYSEKSTDGLLERAGGWANGKVGQLFGKSQPAQAPVNFQGAGQIDVSRGKEGQATVSGTSSNGQSNTLLKTAGDTDDSWIERAGEWGDERVEDVSSAVGRLFGSAK